MFSVWTTATHHWCVQTGPDGLMGDRAYVGLGSAGIDEQEHLGWVCGRLDVGQNLCPRASTDKPRQGENHCDDEILFGKIEREMTHTFVNFYSFVFFRNILVVKPVFKKLLHWPPGGLCYSLGICSGRRCRRLWPTGSTGRQVPRRSNKTERKGKNLLLRRGSLVDSSHTGELGNGPVVVYKREEESVWCSSFTGEGILEVLRRHGHKIPSGQGPTLSNPEISQN